MVSNHFTATGIVFNHKNEVLMILHNKLKVWLPPGGHVEENELPIQAALREIKEETGILAQIIPPGKRLDLSDRRCAELDAPFVTLLEDIEGDGTHNHMDMVFLFRALSCELIPLEGEVHGIGWFTPEQIKSMNTYENVIETVSRAAEWLQSTGGKGFYG